MRTISALVALTIVASVGMIAVEELVPVTNGAIAELNRIGAGERARQERMRALACEAFPSDCPPPVPAWVDFAPVAEAEPTTTVAPTTTTTRAPTTTLLPPITLPKL